MPSIFSAIGTTSFPEMRTTPIPPLPEAVAIAAIVSDFGNTLGLILDVFRDVPLLTDRQDIVDD